MPSKEAHLAVGVGNVLLQGGHCLLQLAQLVLVRCVRCLPHPRLLLHQGDGAAGCQRRLLCLQTCMGK